MNLTTAILVAEEGNGGASGIQGLPAPFFWVRMKRETRRSFLGRRRGGAVAVAAANGVGGDELRSGREGEREQRRGWGRESERGGSRGVAWQRWRCLGVEDAGRQGGGGRGACRRAAATRSAYWHEEEGDREPGGGGLGQLAGLPAGPARWAA